MTADPSEALRLISRSRRLVYAVTAVMAGLVLAAGLAIWGLRQDAIADTESDNHRLGVVLAAYTAQTFQSVDLVMQGIVEQIAALGVHDLHSLHEMFGSRDIHDALAKHLVNLAQAEAFGVVDATGQLVNISRQWPMPDYSLAYQDYFQHFANPLVASPRDTGPYISAPSASRSTGARTVFLARRLTAPDGSFLGVVAAPILLSHFDRFFAETGLSGGTGITILRPDGVVLVRFPVGEIVTGTRISPTVRWFETLAEGGGHYYSSGAFANIPPVFVSVHPLTMYPIVVDVTRTETAALARWWHQATAIVLAGVAATVCLALLLRALGRQITLIEQSQNRIGQQVVSIQASEARLTEQSTLLQTTLAHMSQGIMLIDAGLTLRIANQRAAEMLDLPEILHATRPSVVDVLRIVWQRGDFGPCTETFEVWFERFQDAHSVPTLLEEHHPPNGLIVEVCSNRLPDGGFVRTFTDITERKLAAGRLQRAIDLLTAQVEASPDGVLVVDAVRNIASFNRRFQEMWRISWDLLKQLSADGVLAEVVAKLKQPERLTARLQRNVDRPNQPSHDEIETTDGRHLDCRSVKLRTSTGEDLGRIWFFRDITHHKQVETILRTARDQADRSARAKSDFLAMMSHEIRSPMSGLLGIIELLRETPLTTDQQHMVEMVHGSAASLLRIVNDILDYSKLEAGSLTLHQEATELRQLIVTAIEPPRLLAAGKNVRVSAGIAADVPDWVTLDKLRLRQILANLLANAVKFTEAGTVHLVVTCVATGQSELEFAISDTGIGMTPAQMVHLFEPFQQADTSPTRQFDGTGLGLTISRRLARMLGGDIIAESEAGHGSRFRLLLPLVRADPPAADANPAPAVADRTLAGGERVLVAEDQPTNRWLIERQLKSFGCEVTAVENGRAALAALEAADYDLLVTDCHMPELDGVALVRLIRGAEAGRGTRRMPILGLTADVTAVMRARCLGAGMNDVVTKPAALDQLRAAVAKLLRIAGNGGAAGQDSPPHLETGGGPLSPPPPYPAADGDAPTLDAPTRDAPTRDAPTRDIPTIDLNVFDPSAYRDLFAVDEAEVREWLAAYLEAADAMLADLQRSAAAGDREAVADQAHKLASASLAVGAMTLGTLARRLEAAAKDASAATLGEMVATLIAVSREARAAITQRIADSAVLLSDRGDADNAGASAPLTISIA
jgi:signal transduction histidine kinase/HPt (histidine-containing phosphotransfer) domain-containing protein/ActR/RegA family two-component response regulator